MRNSENFSRPMILSSLADPRQGLVHFLKPLTGDSRTLKPALAMMLLLCC